MIRDEFIDAATRVLAICQSRDPYFPNGGDALILGWAETFQDSGLSSDDLVTGAKHAYREATEGFRPLPSTIVQHARAAYFESLKELPDERRDAMEEANHALQAMGFTPPRAHRISRLIALGRETGLTAAQKDDLRRRLDERKAISEQAPKNVISMVADSDRSSSPQPVFRRPAS
ncbi:hypothetical protein [Nocardia nova]|uniref:hypothetical protein n=1 Tax=Nocardia nova TaxID=37330 RepID=UPI00189593A5|nr:hypothetical protein [Nocardia nova]MBF6277001.1 hypothetical protein [Nocardia nova]